MSNFTELYSTVYKDLYRFALCMMRNSHDAEDVVAEAAMAAYENLHKLRKEEAFKSWIFQIASNICKRKWKEKNRRQEELTEEIREPEVDKELQMDIQRAFQILEEEEQYVVALSAFGGYNSVEIGKILKMNPNTVRSKRKRATDKMDLIVNR